MLRVLSEEKYKRSSVGRKEPLRGMFKLMVDGAVDADASFAGSWWNVVKSRSQMTILQFSYMVRGWLQQGCWIISYQERTHMGLADGHLGARRRLNSFVVNSIAFEVQFQLVLISFVVNCGHTLYGPRYLDENQKEDDLKNIAAQEQKLFSFEALVAATKNFHPNQKLGQGGFGPVYKELDWNKRYDVIFGVARGLLYLHEDAHCCIIHRDIKASNILLDDKWVPKIADFGMARLYPEEETHVNTRVAGTNPLAFSQPLAKKALLPSFTLITWEWSETWQTFVAQPVKATKEAWNLYKKGRSLEIMDLTLASTAITEQVAAFIQIGLLCTQSNQNLRPGMRRVVVMLTKKHGTLEDPTRPGIIGSRYRKSRNSTASSSTAGASSDLRKPAGSSSSAGTSGKSSSHMFGSTTNTKTATTSLTSPRLLSHGKRPMQG
ncbi:hypothetical protein HHK36_014840 [Tetracentron sinense]|uniref:non-specific serine/threonine protein kinase n=1 Tax=Tetracentron sinense TaxID=13715 RepID=A0A834Z1Z2_TETSI|nr:hypothetical protein HHK36_014840 [Tetracentron sinense]